MQTEARQRVLQTVFSVTGEGYRAVGGIPRISNMEIQAEVGIRAENGKESDCTTDYQGDGKTTTPHPRGR